MLFIDLREPISHENQRLLLKLPDDSKHAAASTRPRVNASDLRYGTVLLIISAFFA